MSLNSPSVGWYEKRVSKDEKIWVLIALILCIALFFWMIAWHVYGNQNPSNITYRIDPQEYAQLTEAFTKKHMIGVDNGIPVVMPKPNEDVFMLGEQWRWTPVLILRKNEWYNIHLSSKDVLHGFSLQPPNMNFMVFPGYDYVLRFKPTEAGDFRVVCNEFCGIGHHQMIGRIVVIESDDELQKYGYDASNLTQVEEKTATPDTAGTAAGMGEDVAAMVEAGKQLYALKGCSACHSLDGRKLVAPTWKGIFGAQEEVRDENGQYITVTVDEEYIRESIKEPEKKKVKGYENIPMVIPPLTDEEINQLIAFIKTVK